MINGSSVLKSILKDSLVRPEENGMGEIVPLSDSLNTSIRDIPVATKLALVECLRKRILLLSVPV